MQERLLGSGELPIITTLRKGVLRPYNMAEEAGRGGNARAGQDSVPGVRAPPRSQGEARRAVAWPCLPVAFQDFPAPCQLGGSWGPPPRHTHT